MKMLHLKRISIHIIIILLSYLNTKVCNIFLEILAPTMDYNQGPISKLPLIIELNRKNNIIMYFNKCFTIAKSNWDLRETSWDFRRSPLLTNYSAEPIETEIDENLSDVSWPSSFNKNKEIRSAVESFKNYWKARFLVR